MYRCTIVQIHPPLNALGSKGSEEHYTRLCTRDNVHTDLTSGSPVFPFMVNTVRACGFHRFFADLRREGTTINSIDYEAKCRTDELQPDAALFTCIRRSSNWKWAFYVGTRFHAA